MKTQRSGLVVFLFVFIFIFYVILYGMTIRPWFMRWGATDAEVARPLPGDNLVPNPAYRSLRAVTINAPVDKVWPWIVQIGQDRAGFYSYTWLENLTGADIHATERIVPEWQTLNAGDFVRSTSDKWLGGMMKDKTGWRVAEMTPGRSFVLRGWGALVLQSIDQKTTRFLIRTTSGKLNPVLKVLFFYTLDQAHFIMEKRMMIEIKRLAEGRPAPADIWVLLASLGFATAGFAACGMIFTRPKKRGWLLLPPAFAILILLATSDLLAVLTAFSSLSLILAGFFFIRKGRWIYFGVMWIFAFTVLDLTTDAFLVFGLVFLIATIFSFNVPGPLHRRHRKII